MYKVGDIVKYTFDNKVTGMVVGFADASKLGYAKTDKIVLAMRTNGTILTFLYNNRDFEIVDSIDMAEIFQKIMKARDKK